MDPTIPKEKSTMARPHPCPFCGSDSVAYSTLGADERIHCLDCGAIGPQGDSVHYLGRLAYDVATTRWNQRMESIFDLKGKSRFKADTKHVTEESR